MIFARGVAGELLVGYQLAARLGRWEVAIADDRLADGRWTGTAEVLAADEYLLETGGSFELRLQMGEHWWVWPEVRVEVSAPDECSHLRRGPVTIHGRGGPRVG